MGNMVPLSYNNVVALRFVEKVHAEGTENA